MSDEEKKPTTMDDWQKVNSMDFPIDDTDKLLVFLNGELQGCVIEADAEQGYLIKRLSDGTKVTLKGDVKITFNGQPAARAEVDPSYLSSRN